MKNNFVRLVLAIVIAFGLWLYVITVVSPESEASYYDVPVVFDGVSLLDERELMIISGKDATTNLRLSGNRTDLNKLDKTNITILADLSQIREPGEHKVKCDVFFPSDAGIIEVLEKDPQYITVLVSERARKDVPVRLFAEGAVPEGFIADMENAALSHATVTVSGPKEVVDRIYLLYQHIFTCVPEFVQEAGLVALDDPASVAAMTESYRVRRDSFLEKLQKLPGFRCIIPEGAFYAWAQVDRDADEMADFLLQKAGVVTVPGGAYGENSRNCIRMCFAADPKELETAIQRMEKALKGAE